MIPPTEDRKSDVGNALPDFGKRLPARQPTPIGSRDLRNEAADVLGRVYFTGERFIVTRSGKAQAAIVSLDDLALIQELTDEPIEATA